MTETLASTRAAILRQLRSVVTLLEPLPERAWHAPTRCMPWDVRQLAAHIALPAAALANGIAALRSSTERSRGGEPLADDVAPGEILQALHERTARLEHELAQLSSDELDRPLPPPADGDLLLPARTLLQLALVEIGVHRSDLESALGVAGPLDDDVIHAVAAVVPAWLIFGAADASRPVTPMSYALSGRKLDVGFVFDPQDGWRLDATPGPTCRIEADDSAVALFLLGRTTLADGDVLVRGDPDAATKFKTYLPGP